jgi:6-phosphogluconolactonase
VNADIRVVDDPAGEAAERLAEAAAKGGHVVVTGGSTPRGAYQRATRLLDDWSAAELWFTDERCVPPEHEHSNFRMVKEALLDTIERRRPAAVHRMRGEAGPHDGAAAYEEELRSSSFGAQPLPELDLIVLGLGPDAHTCSLFPRDDALGERERWAVGVDTQGMAPLVSRITLTLPVVNAARSALFLVTGEDKAEAVSRAFKGSPDPSAPGSLVQLGSGELTVILDEAAAAWL